MPQSWTDLSLSSALDPLSGCGLSAQHLSDGALVFLDTDSSANFYLKYTSDRATINTIATITDLSAGNYNTLSGVILVRDASDNLFVLGTDGNNDQNLIGQAFTKGVGHTWTAQTVVRAAGYFGTGNSIDRFCAGRWLNTGGGTGSHGHILMVSGDISNIGHNFVGVFDAGVLLAGSGTLVTNKYTSGIWSSGNAGNADLEADGRGNTSGLVATAQGGGCALSTWSVSNSGVLTTGLVGANSRNSLPIRLLRYASGEWVWIRVVDNTHWEAAVCTTSAIGTFVSSPSSQGLALPAITDSPKEWDAYLDPVTPNKFWIVAPSSTVTSGQVNIYTIPCDLSSGTPVWGSYTVLDTWTGVNSTPSFKTMMAVPWPVESDVDYMEGLDTAFPVNSVLYGDFVAYQSIQNVMVV